MKQEMQVELGNVSKTQWVNINEVDYTAIEDYNVNADYVNFDVKRIDDKEVTEKEVEAVKEAIETYNDEAPTRE